MFVPIGTEESQPRRAFPVVTVSLVAVNILVFLFEVVLLLTAGQSALQWFFANVGVVPRAISGSADQAIPSYLTPLTGMFVHGSLTHLATNMVYLLAFGDNVEDRLGPMRFMVFYLTAGIGAILFHVFLNPVSEVPTIGASGAVAGVLGGYLLLFPEGKVRMFIFAGPLTRVRRTSAVFFLGIWFLMQLFSGVGSLGVTTAETSSVAYWAHIGGSVIGLSVAALYKTLRPRSTRPANLERPV